MRAIPILCAFAALACAQTPPVESTAALNPGGGGATITVRNHSASPLVAFVFIYTLRDPQSTVYGASTGYYDSAIDPQQNPPVPPNGETKIPYYAGQRGLKPQANIEAALFADGSTFGHKTVVQTIFERRNFALVTLNKAIAELKAAARDNTSRNQLISQMQQTMAEERTAAGNNDLASCILTIRNQVFIDLMNARDPMEKFIPAEVEALSKRKDALK